MDRLDKVQRYAAERNENIMIIRYRLYDAKVMFNIDLYGFGKRLTFSSRSDCGSIKTTTHLKPTIVPSRSTFNYGLISFPINVGPC